MADGIGRCGLPILAEKKNKNGSREESRETHGGGGPTRAKVLLSVLQTLKVELSSGKSPCCGIGR
jgi:hypothetical protein